MTSWLARSRQSRKTELTPEEKLLHAIFGRAGEDVKNDSLEVPSGVEGIVIDTQKFSRRLSLSDDERKAFEKELKEAESRRQRRDCRRLSVHWFARSKTVWLGKLADDEGTCLVRDQEPQASWPSRRANFKIERIDIRSPQRKADDREGLQNATGRPSKRPSTLATAS